MPSETLSGMKRYLNQSCHHDFDGWKLTQTWWGEGQQISVAFLSCSYWGGKSFQRGIPWHPGSVSSWDSWRRQIISGNLHIPGGHYPILFLLWHVALKPAFICAVCLKPVKRCRELPENSEQRCRWRKQRDLVLVCPRKGLWVLHVGPERPL